MCANAIDNYITGFYGCPFGEESRPPLENIILTLYSEFMPARNAEKRYVDHGYYHMYNRGVEKRKIFRDKQDYNVFLSYLKEYLLPKDEQFLRTHLADPDISPSERKKIIKALRLNNFAQDVILLAYALMPNHFHLLIYQKSAATIDAFMNSLGTRYSMYVNRKYKRVGPLYQGVYKAVLVQTDEQLFHLTRYLHRNPLGLQGVALKMLSEQPTSFADYLGLRKTLWIHPEIVLSFFSQENSTLHYDAFVTQKEENNELLGDLMIDAV